MPTWLLQAHARGGDITGLTGDTSTVSANVFEAVSADVNEAPKEGKKAKKHHLLGRKKKDDKKADSSNDDAENRFNEIIFCKH